MEALTVAIFPICRHELKAWQTGGVHVRPLERFGLRPRCGFASRDWGASLTFDEQEAKLRLVVETAARAWPGDSATALA